MVCAAAVVAIRDLPSTDHLWTDDRAPRLSLAAADGSPMPVRGAMRGAPVRLAELPGHVPNAVLAIEDRNFYHHAGVNPLALARAALVNVRAGAVRQGGSTITQQLAKNLFLSSEKTIRRKTQELLLAFWLEARFSKQQILTLYLNRVYFGAGAYGVRAASHRYFNKPPSRLSVAEAAILAGLLKAPSHYAPDAHPESAGARARRVVEAMAEARFISAAAAEAALREPVRIAPSAGSIAPYFIDAALAEARSLAALDGDAVVATTFSPTLQAAMEEGVRAGWRRAADGPGVDPATEIAAVLLDGDGAVRALVGGRDYDRSQFNRAVQARRQPGSAFKPFVYLAALEAGASSSSLVSDQPVEVGDWSPANYSGDYREDVRLEDALAQSLNAATVRLQEQTGRAAVRLAARRMGIKSALSRGASLALGVDAVSPLELAGAYAPLANGGLRVDPYFVARIDAADPAARERLYERDAGFRGRAGGVRSLGSLDRMLEEAVVVGTGKAARIDGVIVAGKTGTSQNSRDAWFAGYAAQLVLVVWLGRDDDRPMRAPDGRAVVGGGAPAIIWREIMRRALVADGRSPAVASASTAAAR